MPYRTQSVDTSEVVERVQFDHLRRMGRKQRLDRGLQRVDGSLKAMWSALRRKHPHLSEEEMHVLWARVQFGDEFAARLEEWLECRSKTSPTPTPSAAP